MAVALLLGACGFIGRSVGVGFRENSDFQLIEADLPAATAAAAPAAEAAQASPAADGNRIVPLDLLGDLESLAEALGRIDPDVIVNCAGRTRGDEAQLHAANVESVERLLAALQLAELRPRLIHIGSAAEYGVATENAPVAEDAETRPAAPYGASKLAGTELVRAARARGEVDAVVLRVFNAVGPGMPPDTLAGAALERLRAAVATRAPRVEMGPLDAVRDFVDVRDIAAAVAAAARARPLPPPIVNVGTGRPSTARELVEALARRLGFSGEIAETKQGSSRSASVSWMVADVSAAERHLGWRAAHDLDSIAASLVDAQ